VGQTLTATAGTWNDSKDRTPGALTYAYQWQRTNDALGTGVVDIADANSTTYLVQAADEGKAVWVKVTCTDDGEGQPLFQSSVAYSPSQAIPVATSEATTDGDEGGGSCGLGSGGLGLMGFGGLMMVLSLRRRQR
jgi:hypothetical protein